MVAGPGCVAEMRSLVVVVVQPDVSPFQFGKHAFVLLAPQRGLGAPFVARLGY